MYCWNRRHSVCEKNMNQLNKDKRYTISKQERLPKAQPSRCTRVFLSWTIGIGWPRVAYSMFCFESAWMALYIACGQRWLLALFQRERETHTQRSCITKWSMHPLSWIMHMQSGSTAQGAVYMFMHTYITNVLTTVIRPIYIHQPSGFLGAGGYFKKLNIAATVSVDNTLLVTAGKVLDSELPSCMVKGSHRRSAWTRRHRLKSPDRWRLLCCEASLG